MTELRKRVLVYGYGNPGREDDGLGNEMAKMIQSWIDEHKLGCMTTDSNYQINIEDADKVSEWDIVVFVDASKQENLREYKFTEVAPSDAKVEFTMHAVSPSYVLHLCEKLFNKTPETYVLAIIMSLTCTYLLFTSSFQCCILQLYVFHSFRSCILQLPVCKSGIC